MTYVLAVLIALAPSALWVLVVRWWDRREPEPFKILLYCFAGGVLASAVIAALRYIVSVTLVATSVLPPHDPLSPQDGLLALTTGVIVLAVIQETVKTGVAGHIAGRSRAFSQAVDGMVYATTVAWGAALPENVLIAVRAAATLASPVAPPAGGVAGLAALASAAVAGIAFQMLFSTLMLGVSSGIAGMGLGLALAARANPLSSSGLRRERFSFPLLLGLGGAVAFHASFRLLTQLGQPRLAGAAAVLGAVYLFSRFAIPKFTRTVHAR
jgi:RsiW-degrading membrane proteinase PrsW (M82 family)